jgi:head-tail adaptor
MSMLLSAGELASIRATRNGFLPDVGIIYRYNLTSDGMGGSSEAWPAAGTVSCYVWTRTTTDDNERVTGGQVTSRTQWYIEIPHNTAITAKDHIEVNSRTFQVVAVPNDASILSGLRLEVIALNEERRVK